LIELTNFYNKQHMVKFIKRKEYKDFGLKHLCLWKETQNNLRSFIIHVMEVISIYML